ncbi:phage portal protein [Neisseria sp. N95_16]|uniref:Phage portal protein n=1 Tax=Neisseria brasiliensis TaxID=2666100 RepID=A0A5Q3S0W9_9NEIS|nr:MULTISPECIES: phage portal protein [Neisseria]MRN37187.1 phage portal protein [Neisseria brasiliensis]PJO10093.1 phage portal protein [Neisseria sp. N95_16]PJO78757.1 phage portal protein [Neisseria sp. N177_16]QGL24196.1 phage portal protein [Neisseria brasiliensis]
MSIETKKTDVEVFSWGTDERVNWLSDLWECVDNGKYYEPPINLNDLVALLRAGIHHASALQCKLNVLTATFEPTKWLSRAEFKKLAFGFLVLGNGYLQVERNRLGQPLKLKNRLGLYMRRASHKEGYYYMRRHVVCDDDFIPAGDVVHLIQPDLSQEVYGVPDYLSGMSSAELNRSATTFRRRYYDNGSHAGFIVYATDNNLNEEDWANLKQQFKQAQREGNFKNVFLRSPNGGQDGIKLIPISEVAAKDEFINIKNTTAQDMLTIHRVPPALMGVVPQAAGGLGDARTAAEVFAANEIEPIQTAFLEANEQLGAEVFKFKPYSLAVSANK